ncbi:MAG: tRNA epoxyqueuosine(34) reductase QueG, partial [Bdellovibrionota bacterium]
DLVGISNVVEPGPEAGVLEKWLEKGYAGEMGYLSERLRERRDPREVVPGAKSILSLGMPYRTPEKKEASPKLTGHVARYARGRDYHLLIRDRLHKLRRLIKEELPGVRVYVGVDSGPVLERAKAARAGLGFLGHNTMLIHPQLGSYLFLAQIIVDRELEPTPPVSLPDCGTCTACLEACPTEAFPQKGVLDARRCISYLTIEHQGEIPESIRGKMGDWVFGCDICQEVCPWNRETSFTKEKDFHPRPGHSRLDLEKILVLSQAEMKEEFLGTPIYRTAGRKLKRNALVALGNSGDKKAIAVLDEFLEKENDPLLREHALWAKRRLAKKAARGTRRRGKES